jgi:hypothetical protein
MRRAPRQRPGGAYGDTARTARAGNEVDQQGGIVQYDAGGRTDRHTGTTIATAIKIYYDLPCARLYLLNRFFVVPAPQHVSSWPSCCGAAIRKEVYQVLGAFQRYSSELSEQGSINA